ncbi:hypothetical protein NQ318_006048 [Aromia moschata]|uniref:Uncharacterized protein n=1 Tax=Aromia moschata TaxID=1265417 RepID=A0AAV8Z427_9CUCU|nr:hypothetical protein NQ318_006048 [Aromia moschata]
MTRIESVEAKATEILNKTEADFQHCFQQWKSLMERCRDRQRECILPSFTTFPGKASAGEDLLLPQQQQLLPMAKESRSPLTAALVHWPVHLERETPTI